MLILCTRHAFCNFFIVTRIFSRRIILSKAINSPVDNVRIYATDLLLILARIDVHNFSKWGVDLLVAQMYDENKTVAAASINILHELCYDKVGIIIRFSRNLLLDDTLF